MKDIPDIPKEILKASSNGNLVVFIGAGVSRIIGCPSWEQFALRQLKHLYEKNAINYYEYKNLRLLDTRKLLSICSKIFEEKNILPTVITSLLAGKDKLLKKYSIFDDLYSFNAIYVTTNYDDYLDKVAKRRRQKPLSISETESESQIEEEPVSNNKVFYLKDDLLVSSLTNGTVLHLHGSVYDESSMVATIVDYMKHYEKESKPAILLEEIFKSHTVLFVGYGLEEYEILEFMISKSSVVKDVLQHFMLYSVFKEELNLLKFQREYYADLGIELVPYPIGENGYEHLATVIREWAKKIGSVSRPRNFLDRINLIDEVI